MLQFGGRASWCEKFIVIFVGLICILIGLDYKFAILPLHGGLLFTYLLFIIVSSIWFTFIYLQSLLANNKPFKFDFENGLLLRKLKLLYNYANKQQESSEIIQIPPNEKETKHKSVDDRINDLVRDVEIRFILKWYQHLSRDPTFPAECKKLLDDIVRRFLQVVIEIDSSKFVYGFIIVFLKHIKEFRKTLKRSKKSDEAIEDLYR